MDNYFNTLNEIDVSDHTETKNGLSYLSWAWAWGELKKRFPDANYTIYQNDSLGGMPYFTDGKTCVVKTGVTVNGIEHIEFLPVMDYKNKSIPVENVTSFDVNKAIQRSLTKAVARHGLGLYIYAGEDLPETKAELPPVKKELPPMPTKKQEKPETIPEAKAYKPNAIICEMCQKEITDVIGKDGKTFTAEEVLNIGMKNSKNPHKWKLCAECQKSL